MISQYTINKYTFSDGSTLELEDRITPLNEVAEHETYLSCLVGAEQGPDGSFKGNACFVRVEFSNPDSWALYRPLLNEMMTKVMSADTLCAFVEVVNVTPGKSFTMKHVTGELSIVPVDSTAHAGNHTVH